MRNREKDGWKLDMNLLKGMVIWIIIIFARYIYISLVYSFIQNINKTNALNLIGQ